MYLCALLPGCMATKKKIINDPVFGFINISGHGVLDMLQHPYVQRLTRIRQLGLSSFVYPGAVHTRFLHSIGAMHLMVEAITQLRMQGLEISREDGEAAQLAILLHDIGHGPFSHVLEHTLVCGIGHEELSLLMMERINADTHGQLDRAISIFKNTHPQRFLHQLVSSQLDMDRLDYLCRDSFFCGVNEGTVASARIIKMLNVVDDRLVIEAKGIYSIEKFLVARRLMYWQVYLHKTAVAAEHVLINALNRAKYLASQGVELFASPALHYFLYNNVDAERFFSSGESLDMYVQLDDNDIMGALKVWCNHPDKILSTLSHDLIDRNIFKVEVSEERPSDEYIQQKIDEISSVFGITSDEARYFISLNELGKDMYNLSDDNIEILQKDSSICDITEASDMLNISVLSKKVRKFYFCYQRLN